SKQSRLTVGGDMFGCSFSGQNLHSDEITTIDVAGSISSRSPYSFAFLDQDIPSIPFRNRPPRTRVTWDSILSLALNPALVAAQFVQPNQTAAQLANLLSQVSLFLGRPGFFFNPVTRRLGFNGQMSPDVRDALENPIMVVRYGRDGLPMIDSTGHFVTDR